MEPKHELQSSAGGSIWSQTSSHVLLPKIKAEAHSSAVYSSYRVLLTTACISQSSTVNKLRHSVEIADGTLSSSTSEDQRQLSCRFASNKWETPTAPMNTEHYVKLQRNSVNRLRIIDHFDDQMILILNADTYCCLCWWTSLNEESKNAAFVFQFSFKWEHTRSRSETRRRRPRQWAAVSSQSTQEHVFSFKQRCGVGPNVGAPETQWWVQQVGCTSLRPVFRARAQIPEQISAAAAGLKMERQLWNEGRCGGD